jgi:hypothetical protein
MVGGVTFVAGVAQMKGRTAMQLSIQTMRLSTSGRKRIAASFRLALRMALAALAIMIVGAACAKAPLPRDDSTPPQLYWVIVDGETNERTETPADQPFAEVIVKGHATVTLVAKDSGGVRRIRLYYPGHGWSCTNGTLGKSYGPGLTNGAYDEQVLNPDSKGLVLTEIILIDTAYFTATCDPGWWLTGDTYYYSGEAENYFGGITKSKLQVTYKP